MERQTLDRPAITFYLAVTGCSPRPDELAHGIAARHHRCALIAATDPSKDKTIEIANGNI